MENQYIEYANQLSEIGDCFIEISKKYHGYSIEYISNNKEEVLRSFKDGVNEYQKCVNSLKLVVPPSVVLKEHDFLVNTVEEFVDYTLNLVNLCDMNQPTITKEQFKLFLTKQEYAIEKVEDISNRIGDILLSK